MFCLAFDFRGNLSRCAIAEADAHDRGVASMFRLRQQIGGHDVAVRIIAGDEQ